MKVEGHVAHERRGAETAHGQNRFHALFHARDGSRVDRPDVTANHEPNELGLLQARRRSRGGDRAAFAHDRDLFGDRKNLLESMRDEDDRAFRALKSRDHVEKALDFARTEGGGRLIEDNEIGFERERLGDLDKLPLRRGKVTRLRFERQRVLLTEIAKDLAGASPHDGPRQTSRPAKLGKEYIFEDGEVGRETCFLHHHGDAGVQRFTRAARVERLAAINNLARIAAEMARDDAGERRLPRAVRPKQCVCDASAQTETRVDKRARLSEALRDRARFQ